MLRAEEVYQFYHARKNNPDGWADWENKSPNAAAILRDAEQIAFSEGGGEDGGSTDTTQSD